MPEAIALDAVERSLAAIARRNDQFRAIIQLDAAGARVRARDVDAAAEAGPLRGLTFAVKDLIDAAGLITTGGSQLFDASRALADAPVVGILQAAGAVMLGKSNMHELAVGGAKNPWFGQVVNPLSPAHGTGGTSSGSVAAVAAGFCDFALGTDSGGSNRSTAAATGLYGFKPTNGVLPVDGVMPISPTLDTVGVVARDGDVLAQVFARLARQSRPAEIALDGRVFARPVAFHGPVDDAVATALDLATDAIEGQGGKVVPIELHDPATLREAGRDILRREFCLHYAEPIAARSTRVGDDVRAFLEGAMQVSPSRYDDAMALVAGHRPRWRRQLEAVDALLLPAAPGLAPRLEDEHTKVGEVWVPYGAAGAELRMWANTIGLPAVAIPIDTGNGLPASVQLASRPNADSLLLELATLLGKAVMGRIAA
jgi:Asp-tRNA(Asn)/Glu-tRNA(Gln) amidotransferase A subunit family amidase